MNMATRKTKLSIKFAQWKRSRLIASQIQAMREDDQKLRGERIVAQVEALKPKMGAAYLLHPENKGVNWRAAQ